LWDELNRGIIIPYSPNSCIIFSTSTTKKLKAIINRKICVGESGGLLLGFVRGNHFDVREITIPFKNDFSSRCSFFRRDKSHLDVFQILRKTNCDITYIGEWHTHPEDNPRPSAIDLREWDYIKATRNYPIVFMIFGKVNFYITVK
jgi:integrative and conjugative element protein (TIGR02256 family)